MKTHHTWGRKFDTVGGNTRLRWTHSAGAKTLMERMKTLLPAIFLAGSMHGAMAEGTWHMNKDWYTNTTSIAITEKASDSYSKRYFALSSFLNTETDNSIPLGTKVIAEINHRKAINTQFITLLSSAKIHNSNIEERIISGNLEEVKDIKAFLNDFEQVILANPNMTKLAVNQYIDQKYYNTFSSDPLDSQELLSMYASKARN